MALPCIARLDKRTAMLNNIASLGFPGLPQTLLRLSAGWPKQAAHANSNEENHCVAGVFWLTLNLASPSGGMA
eukprot:4125753-Alexandrium_andersonii.AAC.1